MAVFKIPKQFQDLLSNMMLESIRTIQKEKGNKDGAYFVEIQNKQIDQINFLSKTVSLSSLYADMTLTRLVCANQVWVNNDFTKFSVVPLDGFRNWEDYMAKDFRGYKLNEMLSLIPDTCPTLNYDKVMDLLTRQNFEGDEEVKEFEEITNQEVAVYLDGTVQPEQIYFSSLMRSGNTLLRRIIEKVSGLITGANFPTLLPGCFSLSIQGFKGEYNFDEKVWMVKTHWPYIYPFTAPVQASKAIILVRNPIDLLVSMWQLSVNMTHTKSMKNDFPKEFPDEWEWFVNEHVDIYTRFFQYWLDVARKRECPVYFIRFEDVMANQRKTVEETFEYLLNVESCKGRYIEKRLDSQLGDIASSGIYKPRSGGKVNSGLQFFSKDQQERVRQGCRSIINFFGYSHFQGQEQTDISLFHYDDPTPQEKQEQNGFLEFNADQKRWNLEQRQEIASKTFPTHQPGQPGLGIPIPNIAAIKLKHIKPFIKME